MLTMKLVSKPLIQNDAIFLLFDDGELNKPLSSKCFYQSWVREKHGDF